MAVPGHELRRPRRGDRVHFVCNADRAGLGMHKGDCYAAVVTRQQITGPPDQRQCDLTVLAPEGESREKLVDYDGSGMKPRSWHFVDSGCCEF